MRYSNFAHKLYSLICFVPYVHTLLCYILQLCFSLVMASMYPCYCCFCALALNIYLVFSFSFNFSIFCSSEALLLVFLSVLIFYLYNFFILLICSLSFNDFSLSLSLVSFVLLVIGIWNYSTSPCIVFLLWS